MLSVEKMLNLNMDFLFAAIYYDKIVVLVKKVSTSFLDLGTNKIEKNIIEYVFVLNKYNDMLVMLVAFLNISMVRPYVIESSCRVINLGMLEMSYQF